ncbi:MAG: PorV/PorQ family protein [Crocinitomicaceae bacterium]|nr:PorV/PorQ family protein [Crocinitomicaceae bacterium]
MGEEFREVNIGIGLEYWYSTTLAVRLGYFNEHPSKGARQYLTFGAGVYYSVFGIDVSYLVANRTNPLANTVRFSLKFKFGGTGKDASPSNE